MWTTVARSDSHEPGEAEIGLAVAHAEVFGEDLDTPRSTLSSFDVFGDLDPYVLAASRTDADELALAAAFETTLSAPDVTDVGVVDLLARRRRAPATGMRAA